MNTILIQSTDNAIVVSERINYQENQKEPSSFIFSVLETVNPDTLRLSVSLKFPSLSKVMFSILTDRGSPVSFSRASLMASSYCFVEKVLKRFSDIAGPLLRSKIYEVIS